YTDPDAHTAVPPPQRRFRGWILRLLGRADGERLGRGVPRRGERESVVLGWSVASGWKLDADGAGGPSGEGRSGDHPSGIGSSSGGELPLRGSGLPDVDEHHLLDRRGSVGRDVVARADAALSERRRPVERAGDVRDGRTIGRRERLPLGLAPVG